LYIIFIIFYLILYVIKLLFVKAYRQLNIAERKIIAQLLHEGRKVAFIARTLFRSRSTIQREIERNSFTDTNGNRIYNAPEAQQKSQYRKAQAGNGKQPIKNLFCTKAILDSDQQLSDNHFRNKTSKYESISLFEYRFSSMKFNSYQSNDLSIWHYRLEGTDWRKIYNRIRKRDYEWEECGRKNYYRFGSVKIFFPIAETKIFNQKNVKKKNSNALSYSDTFENLFYKPETFRKHYLDSIFKTLLENLKIINFFTQLEMLLPDFYEHKKAPLYSLINET
jgi:hypothetical protein